MISIVKIRRLLFVFLMQIWSSDSYINLQQILNPCKMNDYGIINNIHIKDPLTNSKKNIRSYILTQKHTQKTIDV